MLAIYAVLQTAFLVFLASPARSSPIHVPRQAAAQLPQYVVDYAPYMYFAENEQWWPTDVAAFFPNVLPFVNFQDTGAPNVSFETLSSFTEDTYLTSVDNIDQDPYWLYSAQGKPNETTAYSASPATVITVQKNAETLDAFYFYFYAFNEGKEILDLIAIGDHVGDWEHVMVRFYNGEPQYLFMSTHSNGMAYNYSSLMTSEGNRATVWIAEGDHAQYPRPGVHIYSDVLADLTSGGLGWDPMLNYRSYNLNMTDTTFSSTGNYDVQAENSADTVLSASEQASADTGDWLLFRGNWGDEQYPKRDPKQLCLFGHCKYTNGPSGPFMKNLGRYTVCFDESDCRIRESPNDSDPDD